MCVVKATEIHSGSKLPVYHTVSLTVVTSLHIRNSVDEPGGAVWREIGRHRTPNPAGPASLQSLQKPSPQTQTHGGTGRGDAGPGQSRSPAGGAGIPLLTPSGGGLAGAGSSECPLQRSRKGEPRITGTAEPPGPRGGPGPDPQKGESPPSEEQPGRLGRSLTPSPPVSCYFLPFPRALLNFLLRGALARGRR